MLGAGVTSALARNMSLDNVQDTAASARLNQPASNSQSRRGSAGGNMSESGAGWKSGGSGEASGWRAVHSTMRSASDSEISDSEHFLTKGAFLLTPSHGLSMEKASAICEKMEFKGCFSLTKTATGILFKFSDVDDYQMVFKKGFHKVTGSRFYRKVAIPCRPQKTFTMYVFDVPDEVPEEDVRHALYKFNSVVEVTRLQYSGSPGLDTGASTPRAQHASQPRPLPLSVDGELVSSMVPREAHSVIRITLANVEEANILLHAGLDFYGATYFPTELASPALQAKLAKAPRVSGGSVSARVRDLLPVFDARAFARIAPPTTRTLRPPVSGPAAARARLNAHRN